jgi:hypothetical protein
LKQYSTDSLGTALHTEKFATDTGWVSHNNVLVGYGFLIALTSEKPAGRQGLSIIFSSKLVLLRKNYNGKCVVGVGIFFMDGMHAVPWHDELAGIRFFLKKYYMWGRKGLNTAICCAIRLWLFFVMLLFVGNSPCVQI